MRKFLTILFLNFKTTFFRLFDWVRVVFLYYTLKPRFIWIDLLFVCHYFLKNPHAVSRDFLRQKGEKNIYAYGETPLTTLDKIVRECRILSKDLFYELGCGSGRSCFWLQTFVRCQIVGVDYLPAFIEKANRIKRCSGMLKMDFILEDMLSLDLKPATAIYLYGTCLEDTVIEKLICQFKHLRPYTKVITVSYPLTDYCNGIFKVTKQFSGRFPWGEADIYLNERLP